MELKIEPARPEDVSLILDLIRELAEFEKEPDAAQATAEQIREALFGEKPASEAVIAWVDGEAAGWALWFQNFSTWTGRPGLWLEELLAYLAGLCVQRGYGRFEWSVLDWNTNAIEFYESLGAEAMGEWTTMRVSGEALRRLAGL
jgi:hypothetical protein